MAVFNISLSQYSMSCYDTARTLLKSRTTQAARAEQLALENRQLLVENKSLKAQIQQTQQQCDQVEQLLDQERSENQRLRKQPIQLPSDLPVKGHSYGCKMISLCLQLLQRVGFRASEAVLKIVFDFFNITDKVPSHDAMRSWSARVGIALLEQDHTIDSQPDDDWIWSISNASFVREVRFRMSKL